MLDIRTTPYTIDNVTTERHGQQTECSVRNLRIGTIWKNTDNHLATPRKGDRERFSTRKAAIQYLLDCHNNR